MAAAQQAQRARDAGQISLFGALGAADPAAAAATSLPDVEEVPRKTLLAWEKEMTGLYISEHPLSLIAAGPGATPLGEIAAESAGQRVTVVAMIKSVRRIITKKNTTMGVLAIEDLSGTLELVAFPECFERHAELWAEDAIIRAVVKVDLRNDQVQLVCESAEAFVQREAPGPAARRASGATLHITLRPLGEFWRDVERLNDLEGLLRQFDGDDPVVLHLALPSGTRAMRADGRGVAAVADLEAAVASLLGPGAVRLERALDPEDVYALSAD
jgi:DNA polymerase-3 subunit alpha